MHHHLPNRKRTLNLLLHKVSGSGKICVLSQIEPQTPRLVVSFRQYLQVSVLQPYSPQNPKPFGFPWDPSYIEPGSEMVSFKAWNKTVSNHRLSSHFRSWPTGMSLSTAFAFDGPWKIILFHLSFPNTVNPRHPYESSYYK